MCRSLLAVVIAGALTIPAPTAFAQTQSSSPSRLDTAAPPKKFAGKLRAELAAGRMRLKVCDAEWKEMQAARLIAKGQTWPKFWRACKARV